MGEYAFMTSPAYHFLDRWRVEGMVQEVADILRDAEDYVHWWGSTYLEVRTLEEGDERSIGSLGYVRAKGWLPYIIEFKARVTESRYPYGFTLEALGDLSGTGIWTLRQDGNMVDVTYDWTIKADKALLRYFSFMLRPLFRSNHNWTMKKGEQGMKLELLRRRCTTDEERARIPAFPKPVSRSPIAVFRAAIEYMGQP
jgi:hypothetical protein